MRENGLKPPSTRNQPPKGREAARPEFEEDDFAPALPKREKSPYVHPATAGRIAASLMFARLFDERPALLDAVRSGAPVVVIDVPDAEMLGRVSATWRQTLFDNTHLQMDVASRSGRREEFEAVYLVVKEVPKAGDKPKLETAALSALSMALPFVAISPLGTTHLPEAVTKAATDRIEFPRLDPRTIARAIRVVTGKPCREELEPDVASKMTLSDLIVAVRFDRTPAECMAELRRLARLKDSNKKSRNLTLSQLHGLGEARDWAESAIADIAAWKSGEIGWDAVSSSVAISGPAGCGKTLFAQVFAEEAGGLNLIACSLAKWQSSGEAHLGHLLRAMRQDFEAARAQTPSVVFIDEIDSFPDRSGITHSHRDYVVEVVNALLAEIDGIARREGVVVIAASNDLSRCDPALLRAGRFDKVVRIGLPDPIELQKMLRVRLGDQLKVENLAGIAELAVGMTGADIERVVKDAKRSARHGNRAMTIDDLRKALLVEDDRSPEQQWRSCVHEASHIVADVVHFGPDDVFATTTATEARTGMSVRTNFKRGDGTYGEYRKRLEMILAGRTGEELLLGNVSHGAGGSAGSDLEVATNLAAAMMGSLGLAGPTPLTYLGPLRNARDFLLFAEIRAAVNHELVKASVACRELLAAHRSAVEAVAKQLLEHGRVDGTEVARLIEQHRNPSR
jgi:AAA+ superfamily predicted ATPase